MGELNQSDQKWIGLTNKLGPGVGGLSGSSLAGGSSGNTVHTVLSVYSINSPLKQNKTKQKPDMITHISVLGRHRQEANHEFEAHIICTVNSRPASAT